MPKKTTETKVKKQAVKKPPIDLSDEQLDSVQGGSQPRGASAKAPAQKPRPAPAGHEIDIHSFSLGASNPSSVPR